MNVQYSTVVSRGVTVYGRAWGALMKNKTHRGQLNAQPQQAEKQPPTKSRTERYVPGCRWPHTTSRKDDSNYDTTIDNNVVVTLALLLQVHQKQDVT